MNLLPAPEGLRLTTQGLCTPRGVTACQEATKACHSLAEGAKVQNSDEAAGRAQGNLFMLIPLPAGSSRSTNSTPEESLQGTRLGWCQASLSSDCPGHLCHKSMGTEISLWAGFPMDLFPHGTSLTLTAFLQTSLCGCLFPRCRKPLHTFLEKRRLQGHLTVASQKLEGAFKRGGATFYMGRW